MHVIGSMQISLTAGSMLALFGAMAVLALMLVAVGGPKLGYAWVATRGAGLLVGGGCGAGSRGLPPGSCSGAACS